MPSSRLRWAFALVAVVVVVSVLDVPDAGAAQLTASWRDNSGGRAAFEIVRRVKGEAGYTGLARVSVGVTSYVDRAISAGMTYCYRVRAYNAFGASPYSEEACGAAAATTYSIVVRKSGLGSGVVYSTPTGVMCGTDCGGTFSVGRLVTLVAKAHSGSTFGGWSGACSGFRSCTISANTPVAVTATFKPLLKIGWSGTSFSTAWMAAFDKNVVTPYEMIDLLRAPAWWGLGVLLGIGGREPQ